MNSSSRRLHDAYPNVAAPQGGKAASANARFIPREELNAFSAWAPHAFDGVDRRAEVREDPPATPEQAALLATVRQSGYKAGYRDGLAALEGFKHSLAQEAAARFNALAQGFDSQLQALETEAAQSLARAAVLLARQVLRSELKAHPEHVARLASEAVNAVLMNARHISVHLHPEDHALVADGASEVLQARQARLLADESIARGGVLVQSDAGRVDARLDERFAQAVAALGQDLPWLGDEQGAAP